MKSTGKNCEHPNLKAGNEQGRCLHRLTLTYKWLKLLTHSAVVDMAFRVKPLIYTIKVPHVIQLLLEEVLMLGHKVTFGENKCIKCCQKKNLLTRFTRPVRVPLFVTPAQPQHQSLARISFLFFCLFPGTLPGTPLRVLYWACAVPP